MSHVMKGSAIKNCGSTNRNENYPSPTALVRKAVKQALYIASWTGKGLAGRPIEILDIGAGSGVWGIAAKQELEALGLTVRLTAIEVDETILPAPEVDKWIREDFRDVDFGFRYQTGWGYDLIFSNPPFSLVYEVAQLAQQLLNAYGVFTLLIGANFLFAEKKGTELSEDAGFVPILSWMLTRRPSFKHSFSFNAYAKENKDTSAKDYYIYFYGGKELQRQVDEVMYSFQMGEEAVWPVTRVYWEYEPDPLDKVLLERPVSVQQALIREAAEEKREYPIWKFDDYDSRMAANVYGWDFFYAQPQQRFIMARHVSKNAWRKTSSTMIERSKKVLVAVFGEDVLGGKANA